MIKCLICQQEYSNLSSHINAKHSINKEKYLEQFPGAKIVSDELSKSFSKRAAAMHKLLKESDIEKYMQIRSKACLIMREIKGEDFSHTNVTKEKMSRSHLGKSNGAHSESTKKYLSDIKTGKSVNLSAHSKEEKTRKQKEQWAIRKEDTETFSRYIQNLSTKRLDYIKEHGITLPKKGKITNIEKKFINFLFKEQIDYQYQYFLEGKYYDFYIPLLNLLVEVDGEYWHRFPNSIKNDLEKHMIARNKNIKLLRITHTNWVPNLIFEKNYNNMIEHNFNIMNKRTSECQNYTISISII